jgi:Tfp pilus assembly protein PilE
MKKHNFTLLEILGVVALIVILMLISVGAYTYAMDSSREKATKATIARLDSALLSIQEKGFMKKTTGATGAQDGYVKLFIDTGNKTVKVGTQEIKGEPYKIFIKAIDADSMNSITAVTSGTEREFIDAWGQALYVRYPGKFNRGGIDIISAGSDSKFGADNADYPTVDITKYKDDENDLICDDISNFF